MHCVMIIISFILSESFHVMSFYFGIFCIAVFVNVNSELWLVICFKFCIRSNQIKSLNQLYPVSLSFDISHNQLVQHFSYSTALNLFIVLFWDFPPVF